MLTMPASLGIKLNGDVLRSAVTMGPLKFTSELLSTTYQVLSIKGQPQDSPKGQNTHTQVSLLSR